MPWHISVEREGTTPQICAGYAQRHVPIICRKKLREKVGVNVQFFIGLSHWQRTRTDFLSRTKKNRAIIYVILSGRHLAPVSSTL